MKSVIDLYRSSYNSPSGTNCNVSSASTVLMNFDFPEYCFLIIDFVANDLALFDIDEVLGRLCLKKRSTNEGQ
jgi:hypothetical protein